MNEVTAFEVGQLYTNDQIRFSLQVENLGGIRPALDGQGNVRHVAVLTTADAAGKVISENPYHDRIEGDIQGTGGFQWNTGGWFGGQIGSTLWLFIVAYETLPKSASAAAWLAFCAAAPNILGCLLWQKRDRLRPYPAIQCLIAALGMFTLLALVVADHFLVLPILDSEGIASPHRAYWLLCLFPVLMA